MTGHAPKTTASGASVDGFLAAVSDPTRRADCQALRQMLERLTGEPAEMWGASIVGFGRYRYRHASGHGGDWPIVGFAPRKTALTVYVMPGFDGAASHLAALGRHKLGKSCLYLRSLADVDTQVLEALLHDAITAMRQRHPAAAAPTA